MQVTSSLTVLPWRGPGGSPARGVPPVRPVTRASPVGQADHRFPAERVLEGELLRNRRRRPRAEGLAAPEARRALAAYLAVEAGPALTSRVDLYA